MTFRIPVACALALCSAAVPAAAQSPALALADGKPWATSGPGGHTMNLTFNPDGTARMRLGPMSRNLTWKPTPDGFCLAGMPDGERCVALRREGDGYVGVDGRKAVLTLTR